MTLNILDEHPAIVDFIQKISTNQGFENPKILKVTTNAKGQGFLGQIFMVDLQDESDNQKTTHVVIKSAFKDEKIRDLAPIRVAFENEIRFFSRIVPEFEKIERNWDHNLMKIIPRCLLVSCSDHAEMLALENLKSLGFDTIPKSSLLNDSHIRLLFKTFGQFHSYSFAMKDRQPELYRKLGEKLHNIYDMYQKPGLFMKTATGSLDLVFSQLKPGKDDRIIGRVEKYLGQNLIKLMLDTTTSECEHSVLVHGDCWSNNLMFKYKDGNNENPIDIRLLDFQLMRIGHPVCDLSHCLYTGASKEVFDKLEDYLKIYHDSLSSSLKNMGCEDPEKLYPFQALKKDWKHFGKFGFIIGMIMWKIKLTPSESQLDFTDLTTAAEGDEAALVESEFDREEYFRRTRDILEHLIEIDVL